MKRMIVMAAALGALVFSSSAVAALVPFTFLDTGVTCPVVSTFSNGVLHLEKNCATSTSASAGAHITGLTGQTFTSGSFTLANAAQCQGGSPRFNVFTTSGTFFLGCNNVTPVTNTNGTVTYSFTAANAFPGPVTGTITDVEVLLDVQGTADVSNIVVNGVTEVPAKTPSLKNQCKHGGWKSFTSPSFKNQGQCVSHFAHLEAAQHSHSDSHDD